MSADLGRRILAEGHQRVNFAIVAAGANAASPHHEPGDRVIARRRGRAVRLRRHHARRGRRRLLLRHHPLRRHRRARRRGAPRSTPCCTRPRPAAVAAGRGRHAVRGRSTPPPATSSPTPGTASGSSTAPATASASRSTRTPTSSPATAAPLVAGHAFSVEPGIYLPGRFGFRLEDIVVATEHGPDALNRADHRLVSVDA